MCAPGPWTTHPLGGTPELLAPEPVRTSPRCSSTGRGGNDQAVQQLVPLVHDVLRRLARRHMAGERPGHVLQATALVNEVCLRLIDIRRVAWQDRAHFFAVAARLM